MWREGYNAIIEYAKENSIDILGEIPMDMTIPKAIVKGLPVYIFNTDCPASIALQSIAERLSKKIFQGVE
jgi:MinD superfamily P-loop ATPase